MRSSNALPDQLTNPRLKFADQVVFCAAIAVRQGGRGSRGVAKQTAAVGAVPGAVPGAVQLKNRQG